MDLRSLVKIVVKLSGLAFVVWTVAQVAGGLPILLTGLDSSSLSNLFILMFPLGIGMLLWFYPSKVANTVIRGEPLVEDTEQFFPQLERTAITLMGLYLFYHGLVHLGYHIAYTQRMETLLGGEHKMAASRFANLVGTIFEIVLSLFFIFGANAIVLGIRKAWAFGKRWPAA